MQDEYYNDVYGITYNSAAEEMELLSQAVREREGMIFDSYKECAQFAKDHLLDKTVYLGAGRASIHNLWYNGKVLTEYAYKTGTCKILRYRKTEGKGPRIVQWMPRGFDFVDKAYTFGEKEHEGMQPIVHRDYYAPFGYFDKRTNTFNRATPFTSFAKETGRDTSHIYTYIEHIAGQHTPYLLAWLRAKICDPRRKTEIMPVICSKAQGSGKSTFVDVICTGLFGSKNIAITDKFDPSNRFNAEFVDKLVVGIEERDDLMADKKAGSTKHVVTAKEDRVEMKGVDPYFQASYTEYVMTSNREVPINFQGDADQRRYMLMDADENFKRFNAQTGEGNPLADEIFNKLYGADANHVPIPGAVPFVEDTALISQFKHELYQNEKLADLDIHSFPRNSDAYMRCLKLAKSNDTIEIETITENIAPFIQASLEQMRTVTEIPQEDGTSLLLSDIVTTPGCIEYILGGNGFPSYVALAEKYVYYDINKSQPFPHANIHRIILTMAGKLEKEYGIKLRVGLDTVPGGYKGGKGIHRNVKCICFSQADAVTRPVIPAYRPEPKWIKPPERIGQRIRANDRWVADPGGAFETVNEMKPGITDITGNKSANVQYMDNFLFEADAQVSPQVYTMERGRMNSRKMLMAEAVYTERLRIQRVEAERLINEGKVWRVVYSGAKSYHLLVRVKDAPDTLEEYKWLHAYLATILSDKLQFDTQTSDPARLTRAPVTMARSSMVDGKEIFGTQSLIVARETNVWDIPWRGAYLQWLERPKKPWERKKIYPVKQEYHDAMMALLSGKFFTAPEFHGRRQQLFFPAYRLCRMEGYTHDELWSEQGILEDLPAYYKQKERPYWETRENCALIQTIDTEVDDDSTDN